MDFWSREASDSYRDTSPNGDDGVRMSSRVFCVFLLCWMSLRNLIK